MKGLSFRLSYLALSIVSSIFVPPRERGDHTLGGFEGYVPIDAMRSDYH